MIENFSNACVIVMVTWGLIRYARGWRLVWHPPVQDTEEVKR